MPEAEENESVLLGGKSALSPIEGSTLPETNRLPPEKWWLGGLRPFPFGALGLFSGAEAVSLSKSIPEDFFGDLKSWSRDLQDDSLLIFCVTCHDQFQLGDDKLIMKMPCNKWFFSISPHVSGLGSQHVFLFVPRILQLNFPDGEHGATNGSLGAGDAQRLWIFWEKHLDSSESRLYK